MEEALEAAAAVEEDVHGREGSQGFDGANAVAIREGCDLGGWGAGAVGGAEMAESGGADKMGLVPPLRVAPMASLTETPSAEGSGHAMWREERAIV